MHLLLTALANASTYVVLLLSLMLVNLLPPIPAEIMIPFSATLFDDPTVSVGLAIVMGTIGLVLGTLPLYCLGRFMGEERCKAFLHRHRRWLAVTPRDVDRSGRWFRRYGGVLVLLGRLIPGMRSMVSLPAGFHAMPIMAFLLWTTVGSALWAALLILAGHWMAHALPSYTAACIFIAVGCLFLGFYIYRVVRISRASD